MTTQRLPATIHALPLPLAERFPHHDAPVTGRTVRQLTQGEAFCYPLYYFIPSFSRDGRQLVYHRSDGTSVQLHVLDLTTGEDRQLTEANAEDTRWKPWCVDAGRGVLDHRSVLNVVRDEVIYFDEQQVRCVDLSGAHDRPLLRLPEDRIATGQNCVSGDGAWFVYIHHDREGYERVYPSDGSRHRHLSRGTVLEAFHLDSGEHRCLVRIDSPIHHVAAYGSDHLVFCHPTNEGGMLLTDLAGGWYTNLRTQDDAGGTVCHYVCTERGVAYEVSVGTDGNLAGLIEPHTRRRVEFPLPAHFGYTHTGWDPAGRLWFFENEQPAPWKDPDPANRTHDLWHVVEHRPTGEDRWQLLMGDWPCYGRGQKAHFHPQLSPDRRWILFAAGDPETRTNHLHLLDVADLSPTQGLELP